MIALLNFLKLYKKTILIILLVVLGIFTTLSHSIYSFNLSFSPINYHAKNSLSSLQNFPEGLVLLSSRKWSENRFNEHDKDIIINWLNKNSITKLSLTILDQKIIIEKMMDEEFNFTSLLQKIVYIPDIKIQTISSDFKNNSIKFTIGK